MDTEGTKLHSRFKKRSQRALARDGLEKKGGEGKENEKDIEPLGGQTRKGRFRSTLQAEVKFLSIGDMPAVSK